MIKHALFFPLIIFYILAGCKCEDDPIDTPVSADAQFVYVNQEEKELNDSTIYLSTSGQSVSAASSALSYSKAKFKNKTRLSHGSWNYGVQWKLINLANGSVIKIDSSANFELDLEQDGQYKLGLYIRDNNQNDSTKAILDATFKTIIVTTKASS